LSSSDETWKLLLQHPVHRYSTLMLFSFRVNYKAVLCRINTIQYSPPLYTTGASLGPPESWTQTVSRSLLNL